MTFKPIKLKRAVWLQPRSVFQSTGASPGRWQRTLSSVLVSTLLLMLLPDIVRAQDLPNQEERYRRVIFVPGIDFDAPLNEFDGPFTACGRAWELQDNNGGTFNHIADHLKKNVSVLGFGRYVYTDSDFLSFSYNARWADIGKTNRERVTDPFASTTDCSPENKYSGKETRQHVVLSAYKFEAQFRKWRATCPGCRFDIIAHSLGGAVVVYWASIIAKDEDLPYIHGIITIDSPINGIEATAVDFGPIEAQGSLRRTTITFVKGLRDTAGDAGRALKGEPTTDPDFLLDVNFLPTLLREPLKVDLTCIGNTEEALVRAEEATRYSCGNYQGSYSRPITWLRPEFLKGDFSKLEEDIYNAHTEPLRHPAVLKIIDNALTINQSNWNKRQSLRVNPLLDREARIGALSPFPIVAPGTTTTMTITMRNTGLLPWEPEDDELNWVGGTLFERTERTALSGTIQRGGDAQFTLTFRAPQETGVHSSEWRMHYRGQPYGSRVLFTVIVLTEEQRDVGTFLQTVFRKAWADTSAQVEQLTAQARREVERLVREEIERQIARLIASLCGTTPAAVSLVIGYTWLRRRSRK